MRRIEGTTHACSKNQSGAPIMSASSGMMTILSTHRRQRLRVLVIRTRKRGQTRMGLVRRRRGAAIPMMSSFASLVDHMLSNF